MQASRVSRVKSGAVNSRQKKTARTAARLGDVVWFLVYIEKVEASTLALPHKAAGRTVDPLQTASGIRFMHLLWYSAPLPHPLWCSKRRAATPIILLCDEDSIHEAFLFLQDAHLSSMVSATRGHYTNYAVTYILLLRGLIGKRIVPTTDSF